MALSTRERSITIIVLIACGLYVLDQMALAPYMTKRTALILERGKRRDLLDQSNAILRRETNLRKTLAELSQSIKPDPEAAESQLLQLVSGFERESGLTNPSFQRVRTNEEHGYTNLTYHVSVTGGMTALATFIYRVETARIPLRVDDVQISPRRDAGDELVAQMNLSTLCRADKSEQGDTGTLATSGGAR